MGRHALDGVEFGQVSSYVTEIKWVTPNGQLEKASETYNPEMLRLMRSSYGLAGVVHEVTLRIKQKRFTLRSSRAQSTSLGG
jgi:FAD/FMN-containing dehydrogenase